MGLMILNGAYISNPPLPKISLKNDTAVKKDKEGSPRKIKSAEHFFSLDQTQRLTLRRERVWKRYDEKACIKL